MVIESPGYDARCQNCDSFEDVKNIKMGKNLWNVGVMLCGKCREKIRSILNEERKEENW